MSVAVLLYIADPINRLTLRALLEASGHQAIMASEACAAPDLAICDNSETAIKQAQSLPTLMLTTFSEVPNAVKAMEEGVFGYILLPFQPGEATIMVRRALESRDSHRPAYPRPEEATLSLAEAEQRHILHVLRACNHNQARAARILGIGRNTLWRKLRQYRDQVPNH